MSVTTPPDRRRRLALAIVCGALLGVSARLGDHLSGAFAWLANLSGPWLVVAFVIGRANPRLPKRAAITTLVVAIIAKYSLQHLEGGFSAQHAIRRTLEWTVPAVVVGGFFGGLGAKASVRWRWPTALLGLALAAEAVALLSGVVSAESAELRYSGQSARNSVLTAELVIAAVLMTDPTFLAARAVRRSVRRTWRTS